MRIYILVILILAGIRTNAQDREEKQFMDSLSYSVGVLVAQNLKKQGFSDLDAGAMVLGIEDVLKDHPMKISMSEANAVIEAHLRERAAGEFKKNVEAGERFLAENGEREEVTVLENGLQYEIIQEGDGPVPTESDKVTTHYTGMLIDGTVFDSSLNRGEPATFPVNGVIKGWQEALKRMPVGSKWKIYVPYDLAYGERGAGEQIQPYSTLIFEIELLAIQ